MKEHPTRAVIYCRISKDRGGEGLGVKRQETACRKLCEERGWQVVETFIDNDTSAYSGKSRKDYTAMCQLIADGGADAIVAYHPDRLHRNLRELENFIDLVEATGTEIATTSGGVYDLTTSAGRMVARMLGVVARGESEDKSRRLKFKAAELREAGKPSIGGSRPYGYEKGGVTIKADEAKIVREVSGRILSGESQRSVVRDLQARQIPTVSGKPWSAPVLRGILITGHTCGYRESPRDPANKRTGVGALTYKGRWPGILTKEEVEKLRVILLDPSRKLTIAPRRYLLTGGIAKCGLCGTNLIARPRGDKRRSYACASDLNSNGCGKIRCLADPLEALVAEGVLTAVGSPGLWKRLTKDRKDDTAITELEDQLAQLQQRKDDLSSAYAEGTIDIRTLEDASQKLMVQQQKVSQQLANAYGVQSISDIFVDAQFVQDRWETFSLEQRRRAIAFVVDRVEVHPAIRQGQNRFNPARVTIAYRQ